MEKTCLDKIIEVIESVKYEEMSDKTILKTKQCIADFAGVVFGGMRNEMSASLKEAVSAPFKSNEEDTALWLGTTGRMPDIDDGHRFAMAHPGVVINSAALVIAWKQGNVTGKQLIEAVVKGYEMYCYLGRVINPSAYLKRGVDATSVCGGAAAAVVVGSLLNYTKKQMGDAVSLAASLCGGLNQSAIDGSAEKYIVAGWGAKLGIAAANMAKYGLGGPCRVFEGKLGYVNAFSAEPNLDKLNNPSLVYDVNNVYIKRYSCVRRIHATLDAVDSLIQQEKITAGEIEKIRVLGGQFLCDAVNYAPVDSAQAQTSVPYIVAVMLLCGKVEDDLVHAHINDKALLDYAKKITVEKDAELVAMAEKDKSLWGAAKVEITTKDGKPYKARQITPCGDPEIPLPENAVEEKFLGHVEKIVHKEYAAKLWESFMTLEQFANTKEFLNEMFEHIGK